MCDNESSPRDELEISPINPNAHRIPGGVWNEDELPVLPWEAPERRIVIPEDLQRLLALGVPVLRWARSKYQRVLGKHTQPIEMRILQDSSEHIAGWLYSGPEPGKPDNWRVFFRVERRWCVAVIGRDRNGSYNVITIHSPSDRNYLPNLIAKGDYLARNERSEED